MKNILKKSVCFLLCIVITAVSFAACSKSESKQKSELLSGLTDSVDEANVTATIQAIEKGLKTFDTCLLYTSPSPRDCS